MMAQRKSLIQLCGVTQITRKQRLLSLKFSFTMVKAKPDINEEPVFVGPDQFSPEHAFFGNFRWKLRDFEVTET